MFRLVDYQGIYPDSLRFLSDILAEYDGLNKHQLDGLCSLLLILSDYAEIQLDKSSEEQRA